jgi:hypothetical protein
MNKTRKSFLAAAVLLILLGVFSCTNDPDSNDLIDTSVPSSVPTSVSSFVPDVSRFVDYEWKKEDTEYKWLSKIAGTITIAGGDSSDNGGCCCGLGQVMEPSYFFNGNVLITYAPEMVEADQIMIFTMSDDGCYLTRNNNKSSRNIEAKEEFNFTRGEAREISSSVSPLKLTNNLLGIWQGEDGKKYVFSPDGGLKINSEQYGYLVKGNELVIVGPLVKGKSVNIQKNGFIRLRDTLTLNNNGEPYTLILSEK